ncbi:glycoside hydrolase family 3 protein [Clostridium sp. MCC353]|uniref:glycoside hydrolase family 3 protein n=1 Tax=Clostridium sp. MCC353 TaxID=2592646 RepID=UPI001C031B7A|nr:glycoside hydrolase family 3 N-terminal domain-containing protein [Clostridium sp. MCC353]MBT9778955.1 glycoside hydrolase family 3 protein [Clostridium sp. MCC353]
MEKATSRIRYFKNENGPVIGVTVKPVIEQDGLYFKDLNGDGKLNIYKDWRNTPKERAKALAVELSPEEKFGLLFLNSWKMGLFQEDKTKVDSTGLLDEEIIEKDESIFNVEKSYGTTYTVKEMGIRHLIFRQNPKPEDLADWINQLNLLAEEGEHAVPMLIVSNSRNENGEMVFGMNDAAGVFATWPGTMGIGAAVKGNGTGLIDDFAECIRKEWDAVGMKKGYMYMADVVTDPRWQRTYGTFGEDPELVSQIMDRLIPGIQGSRDGLAFDGVAVTVKHFPGGGARENGFDPHYVQGQWNVYQTENSLRKYHLPAFLTAVDRHASSIMPYYAKPAAEKSAKQYDMRGSEIDMKPVGFAFNRFFIDTLLREQMGFEGYVNSDSGITNKMAWGVEELDVPSRIALAVNSGVDMISGSLDVFSAKEAYERWKNGYYTVQGHPVPEGYTAEQLVLSEEALNRAVERTLKEQFELGLFENPYRNPAKAAEVVATEKHWKDAYRAHLQSVVLLKNRSQILPLDPGKMKGKRVYAECFKKDGEAAKKETGILRKSLEEKRGLTLTDSYENADYAFLFINPSSGEYFNATKGYLELDICENKQVPDVDDAGCPADTCHEETTLSGADKIREIYEAVHKNGGKVISSVNFTLAWMVGNVEPYADALLAGFDTYTDAVLDVMMGKFEPTGRMPVTLPKDDSVITVNKSGVCVSPNDVPGYDKDRFMPDSMKDENGKAYAYRDEVGNYYELGFGLRY